MLGQAKFNDPAAEIHDDRRGNAKPADACGDINKKPERTQRDLQRKMQRPQGGFNDCLFFSADIARHESEVRRSRSRSVFGHTWEDACCFRPTLTHRTLFDVGHYAWCSNPQMSLRRLNPPSKGDIER